MDQKLQEQFSANWRKHFGETELPITCFYSNELGNAELIAAPKGHRCFVCDLMRARKGVDCAFEKRSMGCPGGQRYVGFESKITPNFEYFLSYGIPGKLEGERYLKTPEMVKETLLQQKPMQAPANYLIFKRWDKLTPQDEPAIVIFFAEPDVLSGLFTLANYAHGDVNGVITPFGAGCASIIYYPYLEGLQERPRAVLGMFDVSARPCVSPGCLTFAMPVSKLAQIVADWDETFLITESWRKVQKRIEAR